MAKRKGERDALIDQLILHESLRLKPYMDSVGKITIGVGRNLTDVGLSRQEAMALLDNDINACVTDLASYPWFGDLDAIRQRVLLDMRFNLGPTRLRAFKGMLNAIAGGNYAGTANAMKASLWYRQVKTRGERLVEMMRTGEDYI